MKTASPVVMVVGANGFLGSRVVRALATRTDVVALVRFDSPAERLHELPSNVTLIRTGDVASAVRIIRPAGVVNAAVSYGADGDFVELIRTNVLLNVEIATALNELEASFLVHMDSFYSKVPNFPHMPGYLLTKRHALECLSQYTQLRILNARLEHVYGPNDSSQKSLSKVLRAIGANEPRVSLSTGEQRRDFIFVDDAAEALCCLALSFDAFDAGVHTVEVGTGVSVTLKTFLETARRVSESKSALVYGEIPAREMEIMDSRADVGSLSRLGWKPAWSLEDGLRATLRSA